MRVGEFFSWADALPELQRQATLQEINVRLLAGQRSVSKESYKQAIRQLEKPVRRAAKRIAPEKLKDLQQKVEAANKALATAGIGC